MKKIAHRLRAAYAVLFSYRFAVMTYNKKGETDATFNVTLHDFRAMVEVIDPAYEQMLEQDSLVDQAKEVLNKS